MRDVDLFENNFKKFYSQYKHYPGVMDIIISDWWEDEIVIIHTTECDVSLFPKKYEDYTVGLFDPYDCRSKLLKIINSVLPSENIEYNSNIDSINSFIKLYDDMILKYELTRKV